MRREPGRVEHDLVLLLVAAGGDDLRDARDGEQSAPDHRLGGGAQVQRGVPIRLEVDEQHLAHDRRDRREERRLDARRQAARDQGQLLVDGLARPRDVLAPVELHPHDRHTDGGRRPHPTHPGRPVQRRFDRERHQRFHLERIHPRRLGQDRHRGRGEVGQHVERDPRCGPSAPHEERGRERDHDRAMSQ